MIAMNRSLLTAITSDAEVVKQTHFLAAGYIVRGQRYLDLGMITEAISDLTTAIKLDPTSVEAYEQRARAHHELADVRKREIDLRRAHKLRRHDDEGDPSSWSFTAGYELTVRRPDGSEPTLRTYPPTDIGREDALLDATLTFSQYEWGIGSSQRKGARPVVYEVLSIQRELRLDAPDE